MTTNMVNGYHDLWFADRDTATTPALSLLGSTGPEGIRMTMEKTTEPITSDHLGETEIDGIYTGASLTVEFVLQEINLNILKRFLAWHRETASNTLTGGDVAVDDIRYDSELGIPGTLLSALWGTLEARPRTGTKAYTANNSFSRRRFVGVNIGPQVETLDNSLNVIPVKFKCYPVEVSSILYMYQLLSSAP